MRGLLLCLALPFVVFATELSPWPGNFLEIETRAFASYQTFRHVNSGCGNFAYPSDDLFTNFSLSVCPYPGWDAEVEILFADTRHRNYGFDSGKATGRYFFLDDIDGDPVSLSGGISLIMPIHSALRDIGSFHHGMAELEGHIAVGLEKSYRTVWVERQFAVFGCGIATQGSPWLRVNYFYERSFCNEFSLQFSLNSLFGLGKRCLYKRGFNGYGAIAHRSIDAGIKLNYEFNYSGTLSLEYSYRIYAKNFPRNVNILQLSYFYSFNL